jgi:hypothetical protein
MEIRITQEIPTSMRPLRSYETTYLYTGFSRYDTKAKCLSTITSMMNGKLFYSERDYSGSFSRSYSTEHVRVTIYSENPKMWSEELSPGNAYFFQQIPQKDVT